MRSRPRKHITNGHRYALVTILCLVVAAVAQALQVLPAWWKLWSPETRQEVRIASPEQHESKASSPEPSPKPIEERLCGKWVTSKKQYNFVCKGHGVFEIYEGNRLEKGGSGTVSADG